MFKRKKADIKPRPVVRHVMKAKTFYSTHTLGLETQINDWLRRDPGCIESVAYAQHGKEFSALILYTVTVTER